MLGLHCCTSTFSSCSMWGLLSSCGAQASHCSSSSCCRAQALGHQGFSSCSSRALEHRLNSCGTPAWLPHSMWELSGPRIEPVSPTLAGGFPTTESPEKPQSVLFLKEDNPTSHKFSPHKIWICASFQRWADTPQTCIMLFHFCLPSAEPGQETISELCAD